MAMTQTRRRFLTSVASAGAAGVLGARHSLADEGPLETTTVRLARIGGICLAPQYAAEELLRAEGFKEISFVETISGVQEGKQIGRGEIDLSMNFAASLVISIDEGESITLIAGVHPGC